MNTIEDMEETISDVEDKVEATETSAKEKFKSKKLGTKHSGDVGHYELSF